MIRSPLLVFGFSGNVLDAIEAIEDRHEIVAFLDDSPNQQGRRFEGIPVLPTAEHARFPDAQVICLIGSKKTHARRAEIIGRLGIPATRFATIVHPRANVSSRSTLGHGSLVLAGVTISATAAVGNHVIILPQSVVHHDAKVGDYSIIGAQVVIAGGTTVGEACYVGSASSIRNGLHLGDCCLVGMGSNVIRDVPAATTVVGNPARPLPPRVMPGVAVPDPDAAARS